MFLISTIYYPTLFRSPMEHRVFGGGGVEQTWLLENAAEKVYVFVIGIFHKVHCITTCTENLKDKPIGGDI